MKNILKSLILFAVVSLASVSAYADSGYSYSPAERALYSLTPAVQKMFDDAHANPNVDTLGKIQEYSIKQLAVVFAGKDTFGSKVFPNKRSYLLMISKAYDQVYYNDLVGQPVNTAKLKAAHLIEQSALDRHEALINKLFAANTLAELKAIKVSVDQMIKARKDYLSKS